MQALTACETGHRSYSRSERIGWYFYDWANSPFSSSVITVFLGPYLTSLARMSADASGFIYPLGLKVAAGSFFPYLVSLSVFTEVIALPYLSAIADLSNRKKLMLGLFAYIGSVTTCAMYWVKGNDFLFGGVLFLVANFSFGASLVFYNSLLPDIAPPLRRDSVSCWGWAIGYLGGGILLAGHLLVLQKATTLGLSTAEAIRIDLGSTGLWWATFTVIPLSTIRSQVASCQRSFSGKLWRSGIQRIAQTIAKAKQYPQTLLFLAAYTVYNDGIQTVFALSTQFGQEELKIPISILTTAILMVQFVAFLGSLLFSKLASAGGAKRAISISLILWILILIYAYALMHTVIQFFLMAAAVAVVMGGSQALSRSLFSGMIPRGHEAEYFSLYEISSSGTSWLGPLAFGLALQFTGSYRIAVLSLIAFFIAGLLLLVPVDAQGTGNEAQSPQA